MCCQQSCAAATQRCRIGVCSGPGTTIRGLSIAHCSLKRELLIARLDNLLGGLDCSSELMIPANGSIRINTPQSVVGQPNKSLRRSGSLSASFDESDRPSRPSIA